MVDNEFKKKAFSAALSSIIIMCRKKKIFFNVIQSMIYETGQHACIHGYVEPFELVITHMANSEFWHGIKKNSMDRIEFNVQKFPMPKDEYHYLLHCVNTLIQLYIERWLSKKGYDIQKFGKETFELSGKKLFGLDFKCKEEKPPETPQFLIDEDFKTQFEKLIGDLTFDDMFPYE